MNSLTPPRILYASFDRVPGCKGASVHIEAFVKAIGRRYGSVVLATPGPEDVDFRPFAPGVRQGVFGCPDDNPIGRARTFRTKLLALLGRQPFDLIHFRSVFEGYPLVDHRVRQGARLLYEVNGFPSVEMKYHYRRLIEDELLPGKLARQEMACLRAADRIITVSKVTEQFIVGRGIPAEKISLVRNGVDGEVFRYRRPPEPDRGPLRIIYLGTFTLWQGIETLLEAVALVHKQRPVHLRLVGPASRRRTAELEQAPDRLDIRGCIEFLVAHDRPAVARLLHDSHMAVVPLLAVDRNTRQGCCPLKLLEATFAGCPVIASDLAVVRELAEPGKHYLPTRPGDARNLKNAILRLANEPGLSRRLSQRAYDHVAGRFTWMRATNRLLELYQSLLAVPSRISDSFCRSTSNE